MLIIDYASRNEKKKISIISSELSKMKKTVIKTFLDIMRDWNMINWGRWNISENTFTFNNGTFIDFLGLDVHDVGKGMRRDLVYFNEANKLKLEAYRQVASRSKLNIIDFNPDSYFWGHDLISDNNFINYFAVIRKKTFVNIYHKFGHLVAKLLYNSICPHGKEFIISWKTDIFL